MQHNRVISFGDSFTWGSELGDCVTDFDVDVHTVFENPTKYKKEFDLLKSYNIGQNSDYDFEHKIITYRNGYSRKTWPALLANRLNSKYYCHAYPGIGNQAISRYFLKFLDQYKKTDLIVINWTFINRWELYDMQNIYNAQRWVSLTPNSKNGTDLEKFYFKYLQSELWDKWESLKSMLMILSVLKNKKLKFIFTCQDPLVFDNKNHAPNYILNAQNELKNNIIWFNNDGFYNWSKKQNFPTGSKNDHPLEEAHLAAVEYIINNYEFT